MRRQGIHDHYVQFGDATTSQIAEKRKEVNDKGESVWMFLVWPSREQKALYDLNENPSYDPENDLMRLEFPASHVEVILNNPRRTRIFVRCGFNGCSTDLTEREAHLTEIIMYLERNLSSLKSALAKATDDLRTARLTPHEDIQNSMELLQIVNSGKPQKSKEEQMADLMSAQGGE
jgi:hypothetical protein